MPTSQNTGSGLSEYEEKAFLKTKAGRLWEKHGGEWSPDDCKAIVRGKIHIGMTTKQVLASWGTPDHVNTSRYSSGLHEQWVYNDSNYVYFENGTMTSLQQSK
jgi:hypothetical protein